MFGDGNNLDITKKESRANIAANRVKKVISESEKVRFCSNNSDIIIYSLYSSVDETHTGLYCGNVS